MTELVNGHTVEEAEAVRLAFIEMMHAKGAGEPDEEVLGDAVAFAGVAKFPARIKCALLGWMALQDAEIQSGLMTPQANEKTQ
jgi:nitrogen fixation NifU-like protein